MVSPHTYRHTITKQSTTCFPSLVSSQKTALQEFINEMSSGRKAVAHLHKTLDFSYHPTPPLLLSPGLPLILAFILAVKAAKRTSVLGRNLCLLGTTHHTENCKSFLESLDISTAEVLIYCGWVSAWSIDKDISSQNITTVLRFWGCENPNNNPLKGDFKRQIVFYQSFHAEVYKVWCLFWKLLVLLFQLKVYTISDWNRAINVT